MTDPGADLGERMMHTNPSRVDLKCPVCQNEDTGLEWWVKDNIVECDLCGAHWYPGWDTEQ